MFLSVAVCVLSIAVPNPDAKIEADRHRAQELIAKLGNDLFRVREEAAKELIKLGSAAKEALEKGVNHPDMEISER